ncbi:hypothetical protein BST95_03770 [Halioglobus japonicus]|uniref:GTPase n=1 Tax=Halioglobus japonicus TaxID=930805 RepID=A0AAP8SMV3_9GAMM|nr:hypothetical protein [Halioglobus japonicus]AQA17485.1 hypothetical protein BST95_03770 [Halioglobus japonicus]PLW85413.1 hypothetical protein C0029_12335 [Halioglobus japonicus]GHD15522.1 hypothetical protein GCM10007052_19820 [Halioglobus japonicus]
MASETPIRLQLPAQDLAELSVFAAREESAHQWAAQLPVANPEVVANRLASALEQLCRCRLQPELRFSLLEALQSNLQIACTSLSRRFLNQPLVMPEEPRRVAALIDRLYALSISAYNCTAVEALQQRDSVRGINPARLVCEALLRALQYCGRKRLLEFQLHKPMEPHGWLTMHQLYALGERQELAEIALPGPGDTQISIRQCYLVAMLTGCCKPNQLRQADLAIVHQALLQWSDLVEIGGEDGLFLVDLDHDQPPLYASLFRDTIPATARKVNTAPLVAHMKNLQASSQRSGVTLDDGTNLTQGLISHMIDALGSVSVRNFVRKPAKGPLAVSIGLSAAHYHAAGDRSFPEAVYGSEYLNHPTERRETTPFGEQSGSDVWSRANPETDFERQHSDSEAEAYLDHQVQLDARSAAAILSGDDDPQLERNYPLYMPMMVNASPGGYCLDWQEELPAELKVGDLVSAQEGQHDQWVLAVIRWISQLENKRTLMGIELLSPQVKAYGAVTRSKTGEETEPQRALLLPEINLVGQPQTLITPRTSFRENQKITLQRPGEELHLQLNRQLAATGSFSQFDFRYVRMLGDVIADDTSGLVDSAYDSVWSNI